MRWRIPCRHPIPRPRPRLLRWLPPAGIAGAALILSGCVTTGPLEWFRNGFKVGPNYRRPPAPVAENWIEANDPKVHSRPLEHADWWNVFQDRTLNSLIETASNQNLT